MNRSKVRAHGALIFALMLLVGISEGSSAAIVTSNNLLTTSLPNLTNPANQSVSTPAGTFTNRLIGLRANVLMTSGPNFQVNGYVVDSFGGLNNVQNFSPNPSYSQTDTFALSVIGTSAVSYTLNTSANFGYVFNATGVTINSGINADAGLIPGFSGNLVPNASLEAPVNFFNGGTIVADPGKQGSNVLQVVGTAEKFIRIPVIPGQQYAFSFWYFANTTAGGEVEWGLAQPADGFAVASGNSSINTGNGTWTQVTNTFTPSAGQTSFYMGTMANGGFMELDSLFVAMVPEPATGMTIVMLCAGVILKSPRLASRGR
jgi:hypothetical protein